jgi:aerotaxis receptor
LQNAILQTKDRLETMHQSIKQVLNNTQKISKSTQDAYMMVNTTLGESQETESIIIKLYQNNKEIEDLINAIADIDVQTRVLALNASIEAERAGDAGKGFAVVASEINDLSRQSKESLNLIRDKMASIQEELGYALGSITKTTHSAKSVNKLSENINQNLIDQKDLNNEITSSINELTSFLDQTASLIALITSSTLFLTNGLSI